jgi:flagellar biosynthesis protein FlhA
MDGSSKFVKGDAIAALIITLINSVGGIVIGVTQRGLDIGTAAQSYTLLTVGDGLVSQVPALLISTATGVIVTRAAGEQKLGEDMASQLFSNPRALAVTGCVLLLLGLVPGLPKLPFFFVSSGLLMGAYTLRNAAKNAPAPRAEAAEAAAQPQSEEQQVAEALQIDPLELEIGYTLVPLVDASRGGSLLNRITLVRRQVALDLGIVLPTIRIRDNLQLAPSAYSIKLRGVEVAHGEVLVDHHLALNPGLAGESLEGVQTTEPAFGLPAVWVTGAQRERAELLGYTVIDPASVITTHLSETIKRHAPALLGRQEVQGLVSGIKQTAGAVVEELIPGLLTLGEVQKVLQNLIRERVSVRDLVAILEALADHARQTRDTDILTEFARRAVARSLCQQYRDPDGLIYGVTVDPQFEQEMFDALQGTDQGAVIAWPPQRTQRFLHKLGQELERMAAAGRLPLVLCSGRIRLPLRRLTERALPNLAVLSYAEVAGQAEVRAVASVRADDAH